GEGDFLRVQAEYALGNADLAGMQGPGADAAVQEGVAELCFASGGIGKVAERAIEWFDAVAHAGIDHACQRVVPQVLLEKRARAALWIWIGKNAVSWVAAAHAGRLHAARGGEVSRA